MKDVIIAFFLAFGFASGVILTVYTLESHRQNAETLALLESVRLQVRSLQDASKECSAIIDTNKLKNRNIEIKRPALPPVQPRRPRLIYKP